jgi:hypothetical protein
MSISIATRESNISGDDKMVCNAKQVLVILIRSTLPGETEKLVR